MRDGLLAVMRRFFERMRNGLAGRQAVRRLDLFQRASIYAALADQMRAAIAAAGLERCLRDRTQGPSCSRFSRW